MILCIKEQLVLYIMIICDDLFSQLGTFHLFSNPVILGLGMLNPIISGFSVPPGSQDLGILSR